MFRLLAAGPAAETTLFFSKAKEVGYDGDRKAGCLGAMPTITAAGVFKNAPAATLSHYAPFTTIVMPICCPAAAELEPMSKSDNNCGLVKRLFDAI
jgi:hypothetical protein